MYTDADLERSVPFIASYGSAKSCGGSSSFPGYCGSFNKSLITWLPASRSGGPYGPVVYSICLYRCGHRCLLEPSAFWADRVQSNRRGNRYWPGGGGV